MTRDGKHAADHPALRERQLRERQLRERQLQERQRAAEPPAGFLEPDQLVAGRQRTVPRAPLSRRARTALWVLRVFVVVVSAMVIYTFVSQLHG